MMPLIVTQDPPIEKKAPKKMEVVLATLPLPAKADPASKGPKALEATFTHLVHGPPKDKIVIKKKWFLRFRCYFFFFLEDCSWIDLFVSNLPLSEALVNESYKQFSYFHDSHISVDIVSTLFNT